MKILITGGAGFVGSHLAILFKNQYPRASVVVFDNLRRRGSETNLASLAENDIQFVHGDIRVASDLDDLGTGFDVFVEASAEPSVLAGIGSSPQYVLQTNLAGTLNCLEYSRRHCGSFIFLSSSKVYSIAAVRSIELVERETRFDISEASSIRGLSRRGINESFPTDSARSFYGATKLASELILQEYVHAHGMKACINRCGIICGPGQFGRVDQGVFSLWVAHYVLGKSLQYSGFGGTGKQVRDLLHPADLFDLIWKQVESPKLQQGDVYNVGGGQERSTSLLEFNRLCEQISGNRVVVERRPDTGIVDVPFYVSDTTKVRSTYQWEPTRSVRDIAIELFRWIRKNEGTLRSVFG